MNTKLITEALDTATAALKADNDRAALLATCPAAWHDPLAMARAKVAAIRATDDIFQQLRRAQAERDAGPNI